MTDLERARTLLEHSDCTCVLCRGDTVYESRRRGVAPLMEHLEKGTDLKGFSAADKVVGRGAALLYALLGVCQVYAGVISFSAVEVLEQNRICWSCGQAVAAIRNRTGDGFCPMETATASIQDPAQAPAAIRNALKQLSEKSSGTAAGEKAPQTL